MLPAPFFVRGFVVRAVAFWAFVRLVVYAVTLGVVSQDPGIVDPVREAMQLTPQGLLAVVALVYGLVLIDARRRNLPVFLANMGVGRVAVGALVLGPVLVAEIIVSMVL
jgi:hypothetical protein